jgi:hypothetical protein
MAVKPVDRIRTMINDLERGARTLGDDIRKRAGTVNVSTDIEKGLRQLLQGLTAIAAQLEKAAGELRRYLESGAAAKPARRKAAGRSSKKAAPKASKAAAGRATKAASKKSSKKKSATRKKA